MYLGHGLECINEEISLHIDTSTLPILPDALKMAELDTVPGGSKRNMKYIKDKVAFIGDAINAKLILSDAQTSGGLLIAMDENNAERVHETYRRIYLWLCDDHRQGRAKRTKKILLSFKWNRIPVYGVRHAL